MAHVHRDLLLLAEYSKYAAFCKDTVLSKFRLPRKPCKSTVVLNFLGSTYVCVPKLHVAR